MELNLGLNDWISCPYDISHRMRYSKFHNHLVKCKEKHADDPREPCPYYASELIHPDDMEEHLVSCKYKNLYQDYYQDTSLPVYDAPCHFDLDQESDEDDDVETMTAVDDRSSLFSATTKSYRLRSLAAPSVVSSDFDYEVKNQKLIEIIEEKNPRNDISSSSGTLGNISIDTVNRSSSSSSPMSRNTSSSNNSSPSSPSPKSFNQKLGYGRAMIIQKLLRSQTSMNTSGDEPTEGFGRGRMLRLSENFT